MKCGIVTGNHYLRDISEYLLSYLEHKTDPNYVSKELQYRRKVDYSEMGSAADFISQFTADATYRHEYVLLPLAIFQAAEYYNPIDCAMIFPILHAWK